MLSSGVFPETFKKSKIIPLYKKGDSSLLSNYRPISLLPTISKIFERIIYNQLYQYFNDNELLAEQQCYGVMGTELRLLTDYLTNRKQYVVFNNHCSDITDIVNGVPQGLILGPFF